MKHHHARRSGDSSKRSIEKLQHGFQSMKIMKKKQTDSRSRIVQKKFWEKIPCFPKLHERMNHSYYKYRPKLTECIFHNENFSSIGSSPLAGACGPGQYRCKMGLLSKSQNIFCCFTSLNSKFRIKLPFWRRWTMWELRFAFDNLSLLPYNAWDSLNQREISLRILSHSRDPIITDHQQIRPSLWGQRRVHWDL